MSSTIYQLLFLLSSIYVFLKVVGYGLYEIKQLKNKSGGIVVILFSLAVVVFSNIIVWNH